MRLSNECNFRLTGSGNYRKGMGSAMNKRFSATKQIGNFVYVLTKVKSGKDSSTGLIGVDMLTGMGARQILINDKKPDYEVDEAAGRLFIPF
ncbi:MAG: hypothetical protein ACR2N3_14375 [Pyrinomonadaceae bacterium]